MRNYRFTAAQQRLPLQSALICNSNSFFEIGFQDSFSNVECEAILENQLIDWHFEYCAPLCLVGRRQNTASIHAESSDAEYDDEDGDKDDDGDGDAGIHAEPSVGRRGA